MHTKAYSSILTSYFIVKYYNNRTNTSCHVYYIVTLLAYVIQ